MHDGIDLSANNRFVTDPITMLYATNQISYVGYNTRQFDKERAL